MWKGVGVGSNCLNRSASLRCLDFKDSTLSMTEARGQMAMTPRWIVNSVPKVRFLEAAVGDLFPFAKSILAHTRQRVSRLRVHSSHWDCCEC